MLTLLLCLQNGKFIPEKSNIWRDCVDGYYDWVKEHIMEVQSCLNKIGSDVTLKKFAVSSK